MASHRWLNVAAVVMLSGLCIQVAFTQQICDACSCQISAIDNPQAIYTLDLICNSGSITWFGADGAIRLELKPLFQGPSRACFLVSSDNSQVKVSQEIALSRNYKLHQIETKVLTKNASNEEFCISSPTPESLHLFIESFVQHYLHSVPKIEIFYDIEKLDSSMSTVYDECKPCTKEEVLDAYCSMDYVIIASLNDVKQKSDSSMSTLTMSVKQIIHQREPEMFHRERRSDQYLTGHITVPTQCGIHSSPGDFLITGRKRLQSLTLKCAMTLREWRQVQQFTECSHDVKPR
nr:meteorin-like protein [Biomphalaria glabrata]